MYIVYTFNYLGSGNDFLIVWISSVQFPFFSEYQYEIEQQLL